MEIDLGDSKVGLIVLEPGRESRDVYFTYFNCRDDFLVIVPFGIISSYFV